MSTVTLISNTSDIFFFTPEKTHINGNADQYVQKDTNLSPNAFEKIKRLFQWPKSERTMLQSEMECHEKYDTETLSPEDLCNDSVHAANMHRITLLARQYADNSLSTEDKARLEILNKRIENLIPSISEKEIAHVEKIIGQLHEIEQADSELRDILNAID